MGDAPSQNALLAQALSDPPQNALYDSLATGYRNHLAAGLFDPPQNALFQRGTLLPLGRSPGGPLEMAWPAFLHDPAMALQRTMDAVRSGQQPQMRDVTELALSTTGGSLLAPRAGMLGMGGRFQRFSGGADDPLMQTAARIVESGIEPFGRGFTFSRAKAMDALSDALTQAGHKVRRDSAGTGSEYLMIEGGPKIRFADHSRYGGVGGKSRAHTASQWEVSFQGKPKTVETIYSLLKSLEKK